MATITVSPNVGERQQWRDRHNAAIETGTRSVTHVPFESPMARMTTAWATYAADHRNRFESTIGEDGVLGVKWLAIGKGLSGLLNGETGRLDCGTVDGFIRDTMYENGFTEAEIE